MELVRGGSLRERIPLPPRAVVEAGRQVAVGLAFAHAEIGLVHLDLKPANLLVADGIVKVADLGIARARGFGGDRRVVGTRSYMSPEQAQGSSVDARADVWALGVTLIELATGTRSTAPESVPWLTEVLRRCLDPDPNGRFPNMAALVEALGRVEVTGASLAEVLGHRGPGMTALSTGVVSGSERTVDFDRLATQGPGTNLGVDADAFIGRTREQDDLAALLLGPGLITLRAAGGMGKTRLAREAARAYHLRTGEQVWFCDLSQARTPSDAALAVGAALELTLGAADPVGQVARAIAAMGASLVVLDNLEQVADAGAVVARLVAGAPDARLLATSREALHIDGERVLTLEPLPPGDAVALLRARAADRGQQLDDPDLAELAARLDAIPLALELAAGRLGMLTARQILDRLDHRFRLLRSRRADLSPRQATLEGTLDWSWELLAPAEQTALAQCAVFAGGFDVAAAEAVLALPPDVWALDALQGLIDRSLVYERNGRLGLFESTRAYAAARLDDPSAWERHARWCASLCPPDAYDTLRKARGAELRRRLVTELDNLRAATRWAVREGRSDLAEACALAAIWVFSTRGPADEALGIGRDVLQLELAPHTRARLLRLVGYAASLVTPDDPAVRAMYDESIALARATGYAACDALASQQVGFLEVRQGRYREAEAYYRHALDTIARHDLRTQEGMALGNLGYALDCEGRVDEARDLYTRALAAHRREGDRHGEALMLGNLAHAHVQDHGAEAIALYEEAVGILAELGVRRTQGELTVSLAHLLYASGRRVEGTARMREALALLEGTGNLPMYARAMAIQGTWRLWDGDPEGAIAALTRACALLDDCDPPGRDRFLLDLIEAETLVDGRDQAARLDDVIARIEGRGVQVEIGTAWLTRARCAARAGSIAVAEEALARAEALAARLGFGDPDGELRRTRATLSAARGEAAPRER